MLEAAHFAGRAINISQTTGAHAMSYKLTSLYGLAHGHAVALCLRRLFPFMLNHLEKTVDPRGKGYLKDIFRQISEALGYAEPVDGAAYLIRLIDELELEVPKATVEEYKILTNSVNVMRLNNNPVELTLEDIEDLYYEILA